MLIVSLLFGIFVCFGIPMGGLIWLKRSKKGMGRDFLAGALAFTISQIIIRSPILTLVLPRFAWFQVMQYNPWIYGLFLGGTAALFEETARWIAMRFCMKGRNELGNGFSYGLGHGGIEAMLLVGINLIAGLGLVLTGNGSLFPVGGGNIFIGSIERLFAMVFHIGASLLVLYGIKIGKQGRYLLLAILLHTILDAASVVLPAVFGVGTIGIEVYLIIMALITLTLGIWLYMSLKRTDRR